MHEGLDMGIQGLEELKRRIDGVGSRVEFESFFAAS